MRLAVCLLLFTITAGAQAPVPTGPRAVTGFPYSLEQTTDHVQTLPDGTRVSRPGTMKQYRDSAGRTRIETSTQNLAGAQTITTILIADRAAGFRYTLDTRTHIAHKIALPTPATHAAAGTAAAQRQRPDSSSESLGTLTIGGVSAQGTRITTIYPVGFSGNDRPITSTSEMWMSTDLRVLLQNKMSDPRFGDDTTTLVSISRAEPDPSLFQIPADYQIVDGR